MFRTSPGRRSPSWPCGAEDEIVPVEHAQNLPDHARVEILDGKGHMVQMEAAGNVNRLMDGFLDDPDRS